LDPKGKKRGGRIREKKEASLPSVRKREKKEGKVRRTSALEGKEKKPGEKKKKRRNMYPSPRRGERGEGGKKGNCWIVSVVEKKGKGVPFLLQERKKGKGRAGLRSKEKKKGKKRKRIQRKKAFFLRGPEGKE